MAKIEKLKVPKPSKEVLKGAELPKVSVSEEVKGESVKVSAPVVSTGKFFVQNILGGNTAVVIGKDGKIVSNPMPVNKANRLADHMNNNK